MFGGIKMTEKLIVDIFIYCILGILTIAISYFSFNLNKNLRDNDENLGK